MSGFAFRSKRHEHPYRIVQYAELMQLEEVAPDVKPAISGGEAILVRLFLRRYVAWCARRRRFAQMEGAAVLWRRVRG